MNDCLKEKCKWYSICKGEVKIIKEGNKTRYEFLAIPLSELPENCKIRRIYEGRT